MNVDDESHGPQFTIFFVVEYCASPTDLTLNEARPGPKPSQTAFPCVDPNRGALKGIELINSNARCLPLCLIFWWELYRYLRSYMSAVEDVGGNIGNCTILIRLASARTTILQFVIKYLKQYSGKLFCAAKDDKTSRRRKLPAHN